MDNPLLTTVRLLDDDELAVWLKKVLPDTANKQDATDIIRLYETMIQTSVLRIPPR